ncbi:52 kDa repressor of the inhibitor of the protein kinase-like [Aphis craccivora]|uniref:52 kDa repressor of the inhibitor of the protein kinase-like n=1 Tax=Aphis craccivora TaxID=307492 RepID=A0A6G0VS10_APHCR|nr:52 kDa repressor of the inhibitor of the protein kinase-like [Aphis craccivora]
MNINTFNDGNFRALLRFRVDSGDTILEEHLKNGDCNILMCPNIWKLLQVLATIPSIPMSTATPERTFSSLKRLKTYLRNSTGETRLNGLALMSIHREINVDQEEVQNRLAKQSKRMMLL